MKKIDPSCRQEMIARLKSLREEIEQDGEGIASLETTFALVLSDVCDALALTGEEHDLVLGREAAAYVADLLGTRVWPVEMEPEEALVPARLVLAFSA